jgi:hypothetical protein
VESVLVRTGKGWLSILFNTEIKNNPLKTRRDAVEALLRICRPLKEFYSPGGSMLHVGDTGAHYGEKSARMEGFARVLWGLGPLFAGGVSGLSEEVQRETKEWLELYRRGLISGTDPSHEEYWGDVADNDQKMVEMAPIALALSIASEKLWAPLTKEQKENVYNWLNQINSRDVHPNNWRFFRILVNTMFRLKGLPYNSENLRLDFGVIEHCYTGDGWYFDGVPGQMDYYIPFAMHFYGLIYAKLMKDLEPEYCATLEARAARFSKDFIAWFAKDGAEIPYGRSLTYRFAHGAFFSALAFEGHEALPWGEVKSAVLGNMRTWLARPIFDGQGILTIGYGYPNLIMSERYNAPGSPYWAMKTFLFLALGEDHPFWQAEEKPAELPAKMLQRKNCMLVTRDESGQHVMAFVTGQHCQNHGNSPAKYEKFVYSNRFGFSVSRGTALDDGAFDSTLAVSAAGDNFYRMRFGVENFEVTEDYTYSSYEIMHGVHVESYIVPFMPWHVRIHIIENDTAIDLADGAFAVGIQPDFTVVPGRESGRYGEEDVIRKDDALIANFPWGTSGIVSSCKGKFTLVGAFPNTNLFSNVTVIPTFQASLEPGRHMVVTAVLGDISEHARNFAEHPPVTEKTAAGFRITCGGAVREIPLKETSGSRL